MRKNLAIAAAIACMLWVFAGCQSLKPFFGKPTIDFKQMRPAHVSMLQSTLNFTFEIHNPNPVAAGIDQFSYNLTVADKTIASGFADKGIRIKPAGTQTVTLPVTVNYMDLVGSLAEFGDHAGLPYRLTGGVNILGFELPYETRGRLAIPKLPQLGLKTVEVAEIGLSNATLNFILTLDNPNDFAVHPETIEYGIRMGGLPFAKGRTRTLPSVEKNSRTRLSLPVTIDFINLGRSAMRLLNRSSAPYELSGNMRFKLPDEGHASFPFQQSGRVNLVR